MMPGRFSTAVPSLVIGDQSALGRQLTPDQRLRWHVLRFGLLSYLKCIIDFNAEVSYCTFQLGMSQK